MNKPTNVITENADALIYQEQNGPFQMHFQSTLITTTHGAPKDFTRILTVLHVIPLNRLISHTFGSNFKMVETNTFQGFVASLMYTMN